MAFGGVLGTPQPQPGGLMGQLQTYMQNNPTTWTTLAGAFMAGKPGFAQLGQTMPVAMRADQMRLEDQRRRNAANMALKALSDAAKTNTAPVLPEGIDGADVPEGLLGRFFPSSPDPTDDMREYNAARAQGFNGTFMDYMEAIKKAGATNVNVGGENKYDQTVGEGLGKDFLTLQAEGRKAAETKTSLAAMEQAMGDPNFYSGTGAGAILGLKRAAVALGGDPNTVASTEAFNSLAKKAALDNMGGSLGSGFSNADRDFVLQQVPTLENTPEGNRRLIEINRKLAERKEEVARMARDYASRNNGRIDYGFYDQLTAWAEQNPLFGQPRAAPAGGQKGGNQPVFVSPSGAKVFAE